MRLIDADKIDFKEVFGGESEFAKDIREAAQNLINQQPEIEAVPIIHAEWTPVPSSDMFTGKAYECSNCNKMRYGSFIPPYCQICGAKMGKQN